MKTLAFLCLSLALLPTTAIAGPKTITAKKQGMAVTIRQVGDPTDDGSSFALHASSSNRKDTHRVRGTVDLYLDDQVVSQCAFDVTLKPVETFDSALACGGGWTSWQVDLASVELYNEHTDDDAPSE